MNLFLYLQKKKKVFTIVQQQQQKHSFIKNCLETHTSDLESIRRGGDIQNKLLHLGERFGIEQAMRSLVRRTSIINNNILIIFFLL